MDKLKEKAGLKNLKSFFDWQKNNKVILNKEEEKTDELVIFGPIGEDFKMFFDNAVGLLDVKNKLDNFKGKKLRVLINSPGGLVDEGVSIYNLLKSSKVKVEIVVMGLAASAASVIAMAGDRVVMGTGAQIMIHRAWSCACGNAEDFAIQSAILHSIDKSLIDIYKTRVSKSLSDEEIEDMLSAETWMGADDAIKYGFADVKLEGEDDSPEDNDDESEPENSESEESDKENNESEDDKENNESEDEESDKENNEDEDSDKENNEDEESDKKDNKSKNRTLAKLGVKNEKQAAVLIDAYTEFANNIITKLGCDSASEVSDKITAMISELGAAKKEINALTKKYSNLIKEVEKGKASSFIDSLISDGRLSPASKDNMLNLFEKHGMEALSMACGSLPKKPIVSDKEAPKAVKGDVVLTDVELKYCKIVGRDPEVFKAHKAKYSK